MISKIRVAVLAHLERSASGKKVAAEMLKTMRALLEAGMFDTYVQAMLLAKKGEARLRLIKHRHQRFSFVRESGRQQR